jgi:lipopolysaccharide/colanic/teichoic acid biosynthesis glycosyltransferase
MALAEQVIAETETRWAGRYVAVGIVDDLPVEPTRPVRCAILGPLARLAEIVDEVRPDRVLVALAERRKRTPLRALLESCVAQGIIVEDAAGFCERLTGRLAIETLAPTSIFCSRRFGPSRAHQRFARVLSLVVAAAGLAILWPLMAIIALAIKMESAGPVLFVQERIGARGRPFNLLKFRTMRPVATRTSEWECDNRDRVTRLGSFLRTFRLDELPQFINVLRGEMNLVGPRPHPVSNFELFTLVARNLSELTGSAVSYYTLRTMIPPGMTGWAQVRYRYANNLDEEIEKLRYDLYYVKHASPLLDLRILAETAKIVAFGHVGPAPSSRSAESLPAPSAIALSASVNQTHAA